MSSDTIETSGEVIPLRAVDAQTDDHAPTSAEADTDTDTDTVTVPAEVIKGDHQRQPIVPEQWQRHNVRSTVMHLAGLHWHRARFHGLRSPWYVIKSALYAIRGVVRLTVRVARWAHWTDGWKLESMAVVAGRLMWGPNTG